MGTTDLPQNMKHWQPFPSAERGFMPSGPSVTPEADEDSPPRPKQKRLGWIVTGLLGLGAAYGLYSLIDYQLDGRYLQETDDAFVRSETVTVSSKLSGYVRDVAVRDNQPVAKGAVLARIDSADFANRVVDADSQVAVANASRAAMQANVEVARAGILQAEAGLAASQRGLAYLERQVALYRPLITTGAESKQTFEQLSSNRDQSRAEVASKQAAVMAARSQLALAQAQLVQSGAQLQSAMARKKSSEADLGAATLTAPVSGRIAGSALRVGQWVQTGQRLLSVVPTDTVYVEANFKETQISLMRPGQPVTVVLDALPGVRLRGFVDSITPGTGANFSLIPPQNATGNFVKIVQRVPVRIFLAPTPQLRAVLVPGLSAHVQVDTRSAKGEEQSLTAPIPEAARPAQK